MGRPQSAGAIGRSRHQKSRRDKETPPGVPASPPVIGVETGTIETPGVLLNTNTLPGAFSLLMSEKPRLEKLTPTSGPGGLFCTPGGKFCCTINPAVREENALLSLLRNAAVPALAMASAIFAEAGVGVRLQTPSTQPSRSVTAMTALVANGLLHKVVVRVTACAMTVCTSASVSWTDALNLGSRTNTNARRIRFTVLRLFQRMKKFTQ